ncbi:alpha/beta fold hydrolase [Mucilaginibacter sp. P25]|uniref:alpha/beta fold hydrolase n=1 Tax=unclassified Mucilaginibacter TaxID=2617802 RepID=UPI003D66C4BA
MMLKKLLLIVLVCQAFLACSQQKGVVYGDNAVAGKYYDIRGIKLYAEVYGKGKPLLMIHGNSSSINAFKKIYPILQRSTR